MTLMEQKITHFESVQIYSITSLIKVYTSSEFQVLRWISLGNEVIMADALMKKRNNSRHLLHF